MYSETIKASDVVQQIKESVWKEMAEKAAIKHELKSRSAIKRFLDAIDKSKKHRGKEAEEDTNALASDWEQVGRDFPTC